MGDDTMLTVRQVCRFFGGDDKPLDPATLYRGIKEGRFPPPVKLSPRLSRWRLSECETYRNRLPVGRVRAKTPTIIEGE